MGQRSKSPYKTLPLHLLPKGIWNSITCWRNIVWVLINFSIFIKLWNRCRINPHYCPTYGACKPGQMPYHIPIATCPRWGLQLIGALLHCLLLRAKNASDFRPPKFYNVHHTFKINLLKMLFVPVVSICSHLRTFWSLPRKIPWCHHEDIVNLIGRNLVCFPSTLTETWLDDTISDHEILPSEYSLYRWDRNRHGGGVAISNNIRCCQKPDFSSGEIESLWVELYFILFYLLFNAGISQH